MPETEGQRTARRAEDYESHRANDACSSPVYRALWVRFVQSLAVSHRVDLAVYISTAAYEFSIDPAFGEAPSFKFEDIDADEASDRLASVDRPRSRFT